MVMVIILKYDCLAAVAVFRISPISRIGFGHRSNNRTNRANESEEKGGTLLNLNNNIYVDLNKKTI